MSRSVAPAVLASLLAAVLLTACAESPEETSAPASAGQTAPAEIPGVAATAPVTRIEVVEDLYHGQTVADPYRWLEDWDDEAVQDWSEAQNAYARKVLAGLPERPAVHARLTEILKSAQGVIYSQLRLAGRDRLFAMKRDPAKQQSILVLMGADGDPTRETVFVDPNAIDPTGGTSIDWYEPSHDGAMVAVSMSAGGSESGDVHVYSVPSADKLDTVIERVNGGTAGGDLAWFPDDTGFYYTRYPRPGERPDEDLQFYQQVWQHTLGTPTGDDSYVMGEALPRIAAIRLRVDSETGRLLAWVQDGDSNRFELHLRQPDGGWDRFSEFGDGAIEAAFGPDDALYVISRADAPRGRLLRLDAAVPDLDQAVEIIPQSDGAMSQSFYSRHSPTLVVAGDRIYVEYQIGGPNELRVFSLDGEPLAAPEQMDVGTVYGLTPAGGSDLYFGNLSYVAMPHWYRFNASNGTTTQLAISAESPVDYSDVEVVREFATSKDGTRVPVNILMPRGAPKDGTRAIVVTGYGGYGISMTPSLSMSRHILFEHGVLFAEANLRGGGEYGETWHRQGNLTDKQNVFDDFAAVIRHLIDERYAAAERVAIIGGSNGGLLMGATVVQHPGLAAAVVSHVGIYDMLRVELDPNGQFNVPEFGTVQDPEQFEALYAYSPYHNVVDGTRYPPILLPTGANDPRVNPAHSRKFAARLQAAQDGRGIVLLRTSGDTGHGGGTPLDEIVELLSDQYAFIFHYLDVPVGAM
jgi:prolyl oligopeptidase